MNCVILSRGVHSQKTILGMYARNTNNCEENKCVINLTQLSLAQWPQMIVRLVSFICHPSTFFTRLISLVETLSWTFSFKLIAICCAKSE